MVKFLMRLFGQPRTGGGICEDCFKPRSVVYVSELDKFLCGKCLRGPVEVV